MNLMESEFEPLTIINKLAVDDGYGGKETIWVDGAVIQGALVFQNSNVVRIAQALGSSVNSQLVVKKDTDLDFHTVFRNADGKVFRVVSNSDDNDTPKKAWLNMRVYDVEYFTIPN